MRVVCKSVRKVFFIHLFKIMFSQGSECKNCGFLKKKVRVELKNDCLIIERETEIYLPVTNSL